MNVLRNIKHTYLKRKKLPPLIIEHMEVDLVFSRLHDKYHLRIMDIGAHYGEICDIFERHDHEHSYDVICVEPMPQNSAVLKDNLRKYKRVNAKICECAISDISGPRTFFSGEHSTLFTATPEWKEFFTDNFADTKAIIVACYTIEDLFSRYQISATPEFDFIKIDTEGHDFNILRALITADVWPFALMFEIDPRIDETIRAIEYIMLHDYSEIYIFGRNGIPTTYIGEYRNPDKLVQLRKNGQLDTGNVVAFFDAGEE